LGTRFVVLALRVVARGGAIPVAWAVLPAGAKQARRGTWLRLPRRRPAVPTGWTVLVLADRGLDAHWRLQRLVRLGWQPLLRLNTGGTLRPAGTACCRPLATFAPRIGTGWQGRGTACKSRGSQLECPLLARWEAGDKAPWLLLTDLPPAASEACWYGLRAGIEQGFQSTKRAGWQWQRTRLTKPERAARLWLAVAVATLWLLSVGGEAEPVMPQSTPPDVTALGPTRPRQRRATCWRIVSVFRRGWSRLLVALLRQRAAAARVLCARALASRSALAERGGRHTTGGTATGRRTPHATDTGEAQWGAKKRVS
jgi:hypothetical protein